jgi:serine phosphatase RsbU (regulator of sigma subunit)/anti-sigma regulatory factor (Ser/Thr protein kinase)
VRTATVDPGGRFGLPTWVPRGHRLPDEIWRSRHRGLLALLWGHVAFLPLFALQRQRGIWHALFEMAIVLVPALIGSSQKVPNSYRTFAVSFGLLSSSAVLVHLSGGVIEAHFHYFVMVAAVALYQDWVPFLAAVTYVLVHHGVMGSIDPASVYNHPAAVANPWLWAGIHAAFIVAISVACMVTWKSNEKLLDQHRASEDSLLRESKVVEALHEVGRTLSDQLDPARVVQEVTDAATRLSEAAFGAFFHNVVDEHGEAYMLYTLSGAPRSAFERFPLPRNTEIFAPTFAGEGIVRLDDVTADPRYGHNSPYNGMPKGHLAVRSYLAVPVKARGGEVMGGLFFGHPEPGRFTEVHERIVAGIAAQAAVAVENARLYESERTSRILSEAARSRLSLLSDVSRALVSSLEVDEILARVAALVAPAIADVCVVDLRREENELERTTFVSGPVPPSDSIDANCPRTDADSAVARAITAGTLGFKTADPLVAVPLDVERDGLNGYAIPLVGRDRVIGILSVGMFPSSERSFADSDDLPLLREIAGRVSIAVENARLFARQRGLAETLQHSLLPDRLPEIPGMQIAARYVSGGPGVEVGGDWYDVIALPQGEIAFAMGDVVGRGERAASLMGQIRNALRAYAMAGFQPTELMRQLNRLVVAMGPECMATLIYAVIDPDTGTLRFVSAGHPPPLTVDPAGGASFLVGEGGVPLGAIGRAKYIENVASLKRGATLLLYTDGLIEDRRETLDEGFEKLENISLQAPTDLDQFCQHLLESSLRDRDTEDDIAMIALRLVPLDADLKLSLPRDPAMLGPLRSTLRRWLTSGGASDDETFEILVAAGEACSNAVQHATGASDSAFEVNGTLNEEVVLEIKDSGRWRQPREEGSGGRGIGIMRSFMDDVEIDSSESGTTVRLRRRLRAPAMREVKG